MYYYEFAVNNRAFSLGLFESIDSINLHSTKYLAPIPNQYFFENKQNNFCYQLQHKYVDNNIIVAYNYYYLHNLYYLIHNNSLQYQWIDFKNIKNVKNNGWSLNQEKENMFLSTFNDDTLWKDIIDNGIYFPFFGLTDDNNNITTLLYGHHRWYSLQKYSQYFSKQFLFIDLKNICMKYGTSTLKIVNTKQNNLTDCYLLSNNPNYIFKFKTNLIIYLYYFFNLFSHSLAPQIFKYRNILSTHSQFNNQKDWDIFINNPFSHIAELDDFN